MGRLFPLLALADLALMVVALIDCLSVEEFEIRALPRFAWVLLILLFSPVGPIAWFAAGRPARAAVRTGADDPLLFPTPGRAIAPDDDPEFLNQMAVQKRKEDEEMLRLWEADLRRREEELRKREKPEEPPAS
jgi:phospholipase D-like protein